MSTVLTKLAAGADVPGVGMELDAVSRPGPGATRMETDELAGIVAAVCMKFPNSPRVDVQTLVENAFQHLKARATVTAHLIPLTLNRSLRMMHELTENSDREIGEERCSALSRRAG